jgi:hypothetical protein
MVNMQKVHKFDDYDSGKEILEKGKCIVEDEHLIGEIDDPGSYVSKLWPDSSLPLSHKIRFGILGEDGAFYFTEERGTPDKVIQYEIKNYLKNLRN